MEGRRGGQRRKAEARAEAEGKGGGQRRRAKAEGRTGGQRRRAEVKGRGGGQSQRTNEYKVAKGGPILLKNVSCKSIFLQRAKLNIFNI